MSKLNNQMSPLDAAGLSLLLVAGVVAFFILCGCASVPQKATRLPLWTYKADIELTVDGAIFDGMGVTKVDGHKSIKIRSKARLDLLAISTCHREFTQERVDYREGWFGIGGASSGSYIYEYDAVPIEKESFCPLYVQAFDKSGVAAWGYLAFRTGENLPAKTECNGVTWRFSGISVCQSRAGFEQAITFDRDVKFKANDLCTIEVKSPREYRVRSGKGFCLASFTDGKDTHRLVLLGYDEILLRGD